MDKDNDFKIICEDNNEEFVINIDLDELKKVDNKTKEEEKLLKAFEELRKIMSCKDEDE